MTVEELLQELIDQTVEIKMIEEGQTFQGETISSDIQTITSQIETLSSDIKILKQQNLELSSGYVDETTPNYINQGLLDIYNSSAGPYTNEEILSNNEDFYSDVRGIKEMINYQFIFLGVIIAFFIVILVIKGFFKHVSS